MDPNPLLNLAPKGLRTQKSSTGASEMRYVDAGVVRGGGLEFQWRVPKEYN